MIWTDQDVLTSHYILLLSHCIVFRDAIQHVQELLFAQQADIELLNISPYQHLNNATDTCFDDCGQFSLSLFVKQN